MSNHPMDDFITPPDVDGGTTSDRYVMPFGKHEGEYLGDVPASYLLWLYDQDWSAKYPDVRRYVEAKQDELVKEAARS